MTWKFLGGLPFACLAEVPRCVLLFVSVGVATLPGRAYSQVSSSSSSSSSSFFGAFTRTYRWLHAELQPVFYGGALPGSIWRHRAACLAHYCVAPPAIDRLRAVQFDDRLRLVAGGVFCSLLGYAELCFDVCVGTRIVGGQWVCVCVGVCTCKSVLVAVLS